MLYHYLVPVGFLSVPVEFFPVGNELRFSSSPEPISASSPLPVAHRVLALSSGINYDVDLILSLPDRGKAAKAGGFGATLMVTSSEGEIVARSERLVTMVIKSELLMALETLALFPMYLAGVWDERYTIFRIEVEIIAVFYTHFIDIH